MSKLKWPVLCLAALVAVAAYPMLRQFSSYSDDELVAWGTVLAAIGALIYAAFNLAILTEMQKQRIQTSAPRLYLDLVTLPASIEQEGDIVVKHQSSKLSALLKRWHDHIQGLRINRAAITNSLLLLKIENVGSVEVTSVSFKLEIAIRHHDQVTQTQQERQTVKIVLPIVVPRDETRYVNLGSVGEVPVGKFQVKSFDAVDGHQLKVHRVNWSDPNEGSTLLVDNSQLIPLPESAEQPATESSNS